MDMFRRENAMVGVHRAEADKPKSRADLLVDLRFKNIRKITDDQDIDEELMPSYTQRTVRPPLFDHYSRNLENGRIHMGD